MGDLSKKQQTCSSVRGPDFIGIGAPRSGTSWLHTVLERHPALWLPPVKELHFFDDPLQNKRYYSYLRMRLIAGLWIRHPLSLWDVRYFLGRRSEKWYCSLFEPGHRHGLLTGEITPAYSTLDEAAFKRILALNPQVRLIYIMRDPVMRTWSSAVKGWRKSGGADLPTLRVTMEYAHKDEVWKRSSYHDNIQRLERVFPRNQIFYGFFEDLCERPQSFATNVLRFLGAEPGEISRLLPRAPVNVVAAGKRPPADIERALAASFLPLVKELCLRFGGPPHAWRARYEALLDERG